MAVIYGATIQVAVGNETVTVTWDTDVATTTDLRLAPLSDTSATMPGFDSLRNLGTQENGTLHHTYTLTIGQQVQAGQCYGCYPVSTDPDSGDPMLSDNGQYSAAPAFKVAGAAGPVGDLELLSPSDGFVKGKPGTVQVKATDANGNLVPGVAVSFRVAIGNSNPANHGSFSATPVSSDSQGLASTAFTPARPGQIQIEFTATPPGGNPVKTSATLVSKAS